MIYIYKQNLLLIVGSCKTCERAFLTGKVLFSGQLYFGDFYSFTSPLHIYKPPPKKEINKRNFSSGSKGLYILLYL